jgi:Transposase DDE domain/Insertion element 4 transposase N-terminal
MVHPTSGARSRPVDSLRQQFVQGSGLPLAQHLPAAQIQEAVQAEALSFRDRLFSPCVTLWIFLSQVLDADHSCRQAVARWLAFRTSQGLRPCSPDPSAYGKARQRLSEGVLARLTRTTGQQSVAQAPAGWWWKGRRVHIADGTTVSMPDTPANQQAFPQARTQKPGLGFPIARLVVVFSLAVGTVLDAALGRYQGKETGEPALLRSLHDRFEPRDVLLADCCYCSYFEIALLQQQGVDVVLRQHQRRHTDFRRGQQRGPHDHVVRWQKPARPDWLDETTYQQLPAELVVREVAVRVSQKGFRTQRYVVATTLVDAAEVSPTDLADLYRRRWQAELNLRSLKAVMQMDVLRGQTPEMVRKEVWAHLLVYNVIRRLMAVAAEQRGIFPWEVSFKGALQTVNAFLPHLRAADAETAVRLCVELIQAIGSHRVGDRPNRSEPRAIKRRPKAHPLLTEPRNAARARLVVEG